MGSLDCLKLGLRKSQFLYCICFYWFINIFRPWKRVPETRFCWYKNHYDTIGYGTMLKNKYSQILLFFRHWIWETWNVKDPCKMNFLLGDRQTAVFWTREKAAQRFEYTHKATWTIMHRERSATVSRVQNTAGFL